MRDRFIIDPADFYSRHKIDGNLRQEVGGIALVSGSIEFWAERLIWALRRENPSGKRPSTDGKPISAVIESIRKLAENLINLQPAPTPSWPDQSEEPLFDAENFFLVKDAIALWCKATREAFECRNTIFHGLMLPSGDGTVEYMNNLFWGGVQRKRSFSSFHVSLNTAQLLHRVFLDLLSSAVIFSQIADGKLAPSESLGSNRMQSLSHAYSVAHELNHLAEMVNDEKY